jgi:hypothetical protein
MRKTEGKVRLTELAQCDERIAELQSALAHVHARRAAVARAIANDEPINPGTGRRLHDRTEPEIPEPTEMDRRRAIRVLNSNRIARKVRQ